MVPRTVTLTGTFRFDGEFGDTIEFTTDGETCQGKGEWAGIREGVALTFYDASTRARLAGTTLTNAVGHPALSSCTFDWTIQVEDRPQWDVQLGQLYVWDDISEPDQLLGEASTIADLPSQAPGAAEIAYYTEYLADDVRDEIGIHIQGVEETEVTADRMFVWVEANYSTQSVLKELMFELYDYLAGDLAGGWEPDIVIRMGSSYTKGWIQSTTDSGAWYDIEDQLQWERASTFERSGQL